MNWTQSEWGFAGGYYDDVISWSARGPTALGTTKPDVLGVGAFGYAPTALFWGFGDGTMAFDVFGGTSMATPVVAGSAALIVQAFNEIGAYNPPNMIVKSVLKSTAVDLGYDPFIQGAGRVDCYRAVSLIMGEGGLLTVSDATWKNALDMIQIPEIINYQLSDGLIPPFMPSEIFDTSWFAGTVKPGENTKADFLVFNPSGEDVTVSVSPVTHKQTGSTIVFEGLTASMPSDWQSFGWAWGNITVLRMDIIPEDADLMTVKLAFPYDHLDPERDYVWNNRFRVMIQDWDDANVDGEVNVNEVWQINYGYNYGTSCEATVGFPKSKFNHTPIIFVSQVSGTYEPIPFKVYIKFYKRAHWDRIGLSQSVFTANAVNTTYFNATLTVPDGTPQGVYEGQLIIDVNGGKTAVPVSVNVPTIVPSGQLAYEVGTPEYEGPYNPFAVEGYFDWGWRYEAGDWKNWLFEFADQSTIAAFVYADWQGDMTDVDMFAIHPMGVITDGTGENWIGNGIFNWTTRTASTEEYVVLWTGDLPSIPPNIHVPELHTVLLHNVLFDGSVFPENLSCTMKMVNVNPTSPIQLIIQPGETKSATFTLSTGVRLTNVHLHPDGEFSIEVEPFDVPEIPGMGSQTFDVSVQVPSDTPPGRYLMALYLTASEIPSNVHIPIFIYVDVPNLEIVDVKVDVGRVHFPSEFAQPYIMTTVKASLTDMSENITATLWYRTTSGNYLSLDLSTAVNPIQTGLYVVEFEVPIDATSCCLVVHVEKYLEPTNVLYKGAAMASFDICSTLSTMNAMLINVNGTTATINTIVGTISANLTNLDAKLTELITNSKDEIIAKIDTVLGPIEASMEAIGLNVTWIEGNVTAIRTSLGDNIRGIIETIDGNVATIKTDIGTIKVNVEDIEGYTANIPQSTWTIWATTALSLIAATCSAVTLLLLRKKPKT
ncbi:MAG: S8 family serine peptidase [Candidatus Bathyarchaeales archaeon]